MTNYINVTVTSPIIPELFKQTFVELNKKVNAKIEEGYKPIGSVNIHKFVKEFVKDNNLKRQCKFMQLIQTMVKESK